MTPPPDSPSKKQITPLGLASRHDRIVWGTNNYHQCGEAIAAQGVLPFQHEEEGRESGLTALACLGMYLDVAYKMLQAR